MEAKDVDEVEGGAEGVREIDGNGEGSDEIAVGAGVAGVAALWS